ncbi:MAG TPA: four helix bundle protein [Chloroflexia bacterium]|jgi:four helix bundle protein
MEEGKKVKNYKDLDVWVKSMDLAEMIYANTRNWPREETYGLTNQIRRAAVSIPSNIAEGQGRASTKEFLHHLSMARGSLLEVETQIMLGERLGYLTKEVSIYLLSCTAEIGRILNGLYRSLAER